MIHREYIEPLIKVVYIKSQPILAGSEDVTIPKGNGEASEWGAKQTTGGWFEENDVEE